MGRIPGFTEHIFPAASLPTLSLAANLGLVLFLFLVGLEVDLRLLVSNWRIALMVGAAGMALPFGLGCAIAYGLYHQFRTDPGLVPIGFGTYMLFVGVAMAITVSLVWIRFEAGMLIVPGISRSLSHPHRAQASTISSGRGRALRWGRKRRGRMDLAGSLRGASQRGLRDYCALRTAHMRSLRPFFGLRGAPGLFMDFATVR